MSDLARHRDEVAAKRWGEWATLLEVLTRGCERGPVRGLAPAIKGRGRAWLSVPLDDGDGWPARWTMFDAVDLLASGIGTGTVNMPIVDMIRLLKDLSDHLQVDELTNAHVAQLVIARARAMHKRFAGAD